MTPRVFISAGEASGDLHGANLVKALKSMVPDVRIEGVGGDRLREAGCEVHLDIKGLAITGIFEVIVRIPRVYGAFRRMVNMLANQRPDVAVLIDAPEFNIRLARKAHQLGIPVVYYISPQVWAWRKHRIRELARIVTKMLVILPFEADVYQQAGLDVEFVGHPLLDEPMHPNSREEFHRRNSLAVEGPLVTLLPGSRNNELELMGPVLAETASLLRQRIPGCKTVVPLARTVPQERAERIFGRGAPEAKLVTGQTYDAIHAADLAIACAGTVTLETALLGTPLVVLYKTSAFTYFIAQHLVHVEHVSLVNLVAGKRVVPEFIQDQANPEELAACAQRILGDPAELARLRSELATVRAKLGEPGASERVARAIVPFLRLDPKSTAAVA